MIENDGAELQIRGGQITGEEGGEEILPAQIIPYDGDPLEVPAKGLDGICLKAVQPQQPVIIFLFKGFVDERTAEDIGVIIVLPVAENQVMKIKVILIVNDHIIRHQFDDVLGKPCIVKGLVQLIPEPEIQHGGIRQGRMPVQPCDLYPIRTKGITDDVPQIHCDHCFHLRLNVQRILS